MKIAFIITGLGTGGAENALLQLLTHVDRTAFTPLLVSLAGRDDIAWRFEAADIPVHVLNMPAGRINLQGLRKLVKLLRAFRPDLIQGWMYHGNLAAQFAAACLPRRVPVVWGIRGSKIRHAANRQRWDPVVWLGAKFSGLPEQIIHNAESSLALHRRVGYRTGRAIVIPNGFDTALYKPSRHTRTRVRRQLGIPEQACLIGRFGRYHPYKDYPGFLQAAQHLIKTCQDVQFALAGRGLDVSNVELLTRIRQLGLGEHVHLLGECQDLFGLNAALDIACSSSISENLPNVIGEAMACAIPCVVTDAGDSARLVGDTGIVVPPADPVALAGGLQSLCEAGEARRQALGKAGRQRIISQFSVAAMVGRYQQVYSQFG